MRNNLILTNFLYFDIVVPFYTFFIEYLKLKIEIFIIYELFLYFFKENINTLKCPMLLGHDNINVVYSRHASICAFYFCNFFQTQKSIIRPINLAEESH